MGTNTKRPPLPAPTESLVDDDSGLRPEEASTELSVRSDETSYSIPENGEPIKISTKSFKQDKSGSGASQTSLLIEYFEADKSGERSHSKPSVRVKVTSSARRTKDGDSIRDTETGKDRKPSSSRRISLPDPASSGATKGAGGIRLTTSNASGHSPTEADMLNNASEMSSNGSQSRAVPLASDVSSMPADSTLGAPLEFKTPASRSRRKSVSGLEGRGLEDPETSPVNSTPQRQSGGRSLSRERDRERERIARRAAQKVAAIEGTTEASAGRRKIHKRRETSGSKDISEEATNTRSRRSSKSSGQRDSGESKSGTESSSFLRPKDADSNLSTLSKSSLANNPKLLQTVEDAIRRMILPQIDEIKRQQSVHQSKANRESKSSYFTEDSMRTDADRALSKSTSEPRMGTKDVIERQGAEDSVRHSNGRRSSKDRPTERRSHRPSNASSRELERDHKKSSSSRKSSRESEGLSSTALKDHDRRERDRERRERRKQRSKSRSRTDSIARTDEEYYGKSEAEQKDIPPLPMRSEMEDSDLTRESIMSASETDPYAERPESHQSGKATTPLLREVSRGVISPLPLRESKHTERSPAAVSRAKTPRSARSRDERSLNISRSDKSLRSKGREVGLVAAGLGGAVGALYVRDRPRTDRSRSTGADRRASSFDRDASPVQSEGSVPGSDPSAEESHQPVTSTTTAGERELATKDLVASARSTPQTHHALTQKRHQGVNLEEDSDILSRDASSPQEQSLRDVEEQRDLKPTIQVDRSQGAFGDDLEKGKADHDKIDSPAGNRVTAQRVKSISGKPELLQTPVRAQSETASLLNPSQLSSRHSGEEDTAMQEFSPQSFRSRELAQNGRTREVMLNAQENASRDRWMLLREKARELSSSRDTLDTQGDGRLRMEASGIPESDDPMPEIGHGLSDDELTNPALKEKQSSVLEGPLGDESEDRSHWPYEPTPDINKRAGYIEEDPDERYISDGNAALMGAAAGLGIGAGPGAAAAGGGGTSRSLNQNEQQRARESSVGSQSSASRDGNFHRRLSVEDQILSSGNLRDEGYISAAQARSPDNITPLSFSKPPPVLFGDTDRGYDPAAVHEDPFKPRDKGLRHTSGNTHGISSGYYDAATGRGINNIQSQDVVALMDHLTARDGKRSARDSEIIMTLVRTAVDMRNNFDDVKKLVEMQGQATRGHHEKTSDALLSKVLSSGPRPQVLGSPRGLPSIDGTPAKKQNIFKRAMKGLGSKSTNDVSRIEDMIVQLLTEIESLKASQASIDQRPPTTAPRESVDTYGAQQAPESGYEPEGQAGTSSTPNRSGFLTPEARKSQPRMHSGYENNRISTNRVSTVFEGDEEMDQDGVALQTPTQVAQQQRQVPYGTTQMRGLDAQHSENSPNLPLSSEERRKSDKRFSIPHVSRWSKTTSSSGAENRLSTDTNPWGNRPISFASQSGEALDVIPPEGSHWVRPEDDRLLSPDSRVKGEEQDRTVSPLLPSQRGLGPDLDDPKYQANRHSLTLQHPQPRQGPTGRHQSNLESQADDFGDDEAMSSGTPDNELFGSVPALARFRGGGFAHTRLSGVHNGPLSPPTSSHGDPDSPRAYYSQTQQQGQTGPSRPPKIREDLPVIPPKLPLSQQQQLNREQTDTRSDTYTSSPSQVTITTEEASDDDDDDEQGSPEFPLSPLERKRSPYMPGGPLAPIEERYSMEGERSSLAYSLSQRSKRESVVDGATGAGFDSQSHSRHGSLNHGQGPMLAQVDEGDERASTPRLSPRPAVGAAEKGGEVRRLTGPREMPMSTGAAGGLRGTIRRKPVFGEA